LKYQAIFALKIPKNLTFFISRGIIGHREQINRKGVKKSVNENQIRRFEEYLEERVADGKKQQKKCASSPQVANLHRAYAGAYECALFAFKFIKSA